MSKNKIKEIFENVIESIGMFLWMLIPSTPALAIYAFMFLPITNIWFWVLVIATIIPIIIVRPGINSCSQYHNMYIVTILASVVVLIARLLGYLPVVM